MPKVKMNKARELRLPEDFLERRRIQPEQEFWLDERNGELILHPRRPDVQKLYLEPTTACNLECITCIRNTWADPNQHMSMQTFQRVVESLDGLPDLKRVVFTSFGEPFTQPHLLDMVEAMRKRDLAVTIGTNGLLVNSKMAAELVKLGVDRVVFSIDGGTPETYAGVRGAMLAQVISHIRGLNEAKRQLRSLLPHIGVEFVAMKSNVDELDDLVALAKELNVSRLLVSNVLPYTEELREEVLYGYEPIPPFKASGWALKLDAWVSWATQELPRMHWGAERKCRFIQDHAMVVGWDGGVAPCYALSHNYSYYTIDGVRKQVERYLLGNVNDQLLADIWQSEDYVRFRSEVKVYHFPSCPNCDLRESCDLRKQNQACWGWNPSCADCLWAQGIIRCP
ncbi:MAG TPA: tungsten cofactor oxidoreductase radical SAM maturase [Chthonomonadales bacterium]|nr:tungsten cofactor oxidoreductase radical SAM maturase [Chthonomonadales bacterium]